MSRNLMVLFSMLVLSFSVGCSDDDDPSNNGNNGSNNASNNGTNTSNNGTNTSNNGTNTSNNGTNTSNNGTNTSNNGTNGSNNGTAILACSDAEATECFTNSDCESTETCRDIGTTDLEVACCVTGERGTGVLGDTCTSEDDCASGLCIDKASGTAGYVCSQECDNDTLTCPTGFACEIIGACYPE